MVSVLLNMGSWQNYGHFLGTLNNRCRIIFGTQKGTIILTTTHIVSINVVFIVMPITVSSISIVI